MRILMIRHGDPDYINDSLTEKGWREAQLLAKTAADLDLGTCYVSPLGRAKDTAYCSLKETGKKAKVLDWLREFPAEIDVNIHPKLLSAYPDTRKNEEGSFSKRICWDMVPSYYTKQEELFDRKQWLESEICRLSDTKEVYEHVTEQFDRLLAEYGYVRDGLAYRVEKENTETITFFCHFGLICVLLSRLWNVSPIPLWHGLALAPSSVTEIVTEEREQGIAHFRALRLGDQSHLYAGKEEPSFACRFCETYSNMDQRH